MHRSKVKYSDSTVKIESIESVHPLIALEDLRLKLESTHQSLINCARCRIDVTYKASDGFGSYITKKGKPTKKAINMFEPTSKIHLISTVENQKIEYENGWIA